MPLPYSAVILKLDSALSSVLSSLIDRRSLPMKAQLFCVSRDGLLAARNFFT